MLVRYSNLQEVLGIKVGEKYRRHNTSAPLEVLGFVDSKNLTVSSDHPTHVFLISETCYTDPRVVSLSDFKADYVLVSQPKQFFIGQRVILNKREIGTVVQPESDGPFDIWVYSPTKGFASSYSFDNVEALPNGQL